MRRSLAIPAAAGLLLAAACSDGTGPDRRFPVTVVHAWAPDAARASVTAEARNRSLLLHGGPGLSCGVEAVAGEAWLDDDRLVVRLDFTPPGSCPFVPAAVLWDAVVTRIPGGTYQLRVLQQYTSQDEDTAVLEQPVTIPDLPF